MHNAGTSTDTPQINRGPTGYGPWVSQSDPRVSLAILVLTDCAIARTREQGPSRIAARSCSHLNPTSEQFVHASSLRPPIS